MMPYWVCVYTITKNTNQHIIYTYYRTRKTHFRTRSPSDYGWDLSLNRKGTSLTKNLTTNIVYTYIYIERKNKIHSKVTMLYKHRKHSRPLSPQTLNLFL